jgi:hypothetical protein
LLGVDYAAKSADSETGGVRINMIPREGGNTYRGSFFTNASVSALQSSHSTAELEKKGLSAPNKLKNLWSVNPTYGGPIVRDKVWFFGTYTYQVADQYVANSYLNKDPLAWNYDPDLTQQAVDDQNSRDMSARITWQVTNKNKITAYTSYNMSCHCHFLIGGATRSDASLFLRIPNYLYQMTWTATLTNKLLIDAGASYILQDQQFSPRPESLAPQITDTGKTSRIARHDHHGRLHAGAGSRATSASPEALAEGEHNDDGVLRNSQTRVGSVAFKRRTASRRVHGTRASRPTAWRTSASTWISGRSNGLRQCGFAVRYFEVTPRSIHAASQLCRSPASSP